MAVSEWDPIGLCPFDDAWERGQPPWAVRFQDLLEQVIQEQSHSV